MSTSLAIPFRRSRGLRLPMPRLLALAVLPVLAAPSAQAGTLLSTTFDAADPWPAKYTYAYGSERPRVSLSRDTATSVPQGRLSPSLKFDASFATTSTANYWGAGFSSGPLDWSNTETDLGKLTLGFDLWMSENKPIRVRVRVRSYAVKGGAATGQLDLVIASPAARSYYRHSIDLSAMETTAGRFDPTAPFIDVNFDINSFDGESGWARGGTKTVRVDNLSLAKPSYYVKPASQGGSDRADGRTEATAFATVQKAIDQATTSGDVVVVLPGTYERRGGYLGNFARNGSRAAINGTPDRWIVLRGHPNRAKPLLKGDYWALLSADHQSSYIEIRGLDLQGNRAELTLAQAYGNNGASGDYASTGAGSPRFNGSGISIDGRKGSATAVPHHFRILENRVHDFPNAGISTLDSDYITTAGNVVYNNVWYTRYGSSGITYNTSRPIDANTTYKHYLIGNTVFRNQAYVPWKRDGRAAEDSYSDGNGIILDVLNEHGYTGATLVQNNLSFLNGGSGIHALDSNRVHIVNNTAYQNGQTPQTRYGQIFAQPLRQRAMTGVVLANNVTYGLQGQATNSVSTSRLSSLANAQHLNNLYFDGDTTVNYNAGVGDLLADPQFKLRPAGPADRRLPPSNAAVPAFDFNLAADSPARASGTADDSTGYYPIVDITGRFRPSGNARDRGALQFVPAAASASK